METKITSRDIRKGFARILQLLTIRRNHNLPKRINSLVILAPERYGDAILLTPLLECLNQLAPDIDIYLITFRKSITNFFLEDKNIKSVFYIKKNIFKTCFFLLSKKFDVLYNSKDAPSTNYLLQSIMVRADYKVAHYNDYFKGLFDHLIHIEYYSHIMIRHGALLNVLGLNIDNFPLKRPYIPTMSISNEILLFCKEITRRKVIGVNISAGHGCRHWDILYWKDLIAHFQNETFIIFSDQKNLNEKIYIEEHLSNVKKSPITKNLYEVGILVHYIKILITPDTSFVHIASCYDTPIVALYRNRKADQTRFTPLSSIQKMVISSDESVHSIKTKEVIDATELMLEIINTCHRSN